jgi:hypothetical protein
MTKKYNTLLLPSRQSVVEILNSIQPALSPKQVECARATIREFEQFIKSSTFALDDRGKLFLDKGWSDGEFCLDDLVAKIPTQLQFDLSAESNKDDQIALKKIINLYKEALRSTWFNELIDSDLMIDEFREERIKEQWPITRQQEIQDCIYHPDFLNKMREKKIHEIYDAVPKEPSEVFRSRYSGW